MPDRVAGANPDEGELADKLGEPEAMELDPTYPPTNRMPVSLSSHLREIEHAGGVVTADLSALDIMISARTDGILSLAPVSGRKSDLSGGGAVLYRAYDLEVALTPTELVRLFRLRLKKMEVLRLRDRYGDAFEWHDDFYCQAIGRQLQPRD